MMIILKNNIISLTLILNTPDNILNTFDLNISKVVTPLAYGIYKIQETYLLLSVPQYNLSIFSCNNYTIYKNNFGLLKDYENFEPESTEARP